MSALLLAGIFLSHMRTPSLTGDIRQHKNFVSKILGGYKRDIIVYLPPNYKSEVSQRYPVFYFHDGQNLMDGATSFIPNKEWRLDETAEALISSKAVPPFIIVGINNSGLGRADEYLPTRVKLLGGKADDYGRFITDELMPFIDKTYRTKTGPENTLMAGSSLGAIVTLHLGLTRPDKFGRIAVISPSAWWDDQLMLKRVSALTAKPKLKIWLDFGTAEGGPSDLAAARSLHEAFVKKGWTEGSDFVYFEDVGGEHNEESWAKRVGMIFMFLLR